ncbi:hypothetical protein [Actinokineospora sp.]|uniref:hypothetical protein n=1 Tax=Actinokineospora sp. TaxID=1872133 RepID=UPI0040381F9E
MTSSGPWWAIPAFTLGGVLLTLLVTVWLDHRKGKRETAARLVEHTRESVFRWTERKLDLYGRHLKNCRELRDVEVWPAADIGSPVDAIVGTATEIVFIAPAAVSGPAERTVTAAHALADVVTEIRANSKPGHQGTIDARFRDRFADAEREFAAAVTAFTAAARRDADIDPASRETDQPR